MAEEISVLRLNLLRGLYLLNCLLVGSGVVTQFMQRQAPWDPLTGVAFSFWAALAVLSALGVRYPLAMLPLIFIQLLYKTFWLVAVYLPLRAAGRSSDLAVGFAVAIVVEVIIIPWGHVLSHYLRRPADRWRGSSTPPGGV